MYLKALAASVVIIGGAVGGIPAAKAGSLDAKADGGFHYVFETCEKPETPVLATDKRSPGRITQAARNRAISQYNEYVEKTNLYLQCLSREAQSDLDAIYNAVAEAQKAEQADVMRSAESLRGAVTDER